jgi:hypothetical protein
MPSKVAIVDPGASMEPEFMPHPLAWEYFPSSSGFDVLVQYPGFIAFTLG